MENNNHNDQESRIKGMIDSSLDGMIIIDAKGIVITFNPAAEKMFGYVASEVLGNNVNMLMPEPYSGQHDQYINSYIHTGEKKVIGIGRAVECKMKCGGTFPAFLTISEFTANNKRYFTGTLRDYSELKIRELEVENLLDKLLESTDSSQFDINETKQFYRDLTLSIFDQGALNKLKQNKYLGASKPILNLPSSYILFQSEIINILRNSSSYEEFIAGLVSIITKTFKYEIGHFYTYNLGSDQLESSGVFYTSSEEKYAEFIRITKKYTFALGVGLPGLAWERKECIFYEDVYKSSNFPRAKESQFLKIMGGLAFPIYKDNLIVGVFEFYSDKGVKLNSEELRFFDSFSSYIGNFISIFKKNRELDLILDAAGEGIYGLDLAGNTTFVNPSACRILGYEAHELVGKPMHIMVHHSYPDGSVYPREKCYMYAAFNEGKVHCIDDEVLWHKDGTAIPVRYTVTPIFENNIIQGAVVTFIDISNEKAALNALEELAHYDTLTKLPNRYSFNEELDKILDITDEKKQHLAVLFIDIDNFKNVNDGHGHNVGDQLLISASKRIKQALRKSDFLARLGGDEFAAILTQLDQPQMIGYIVEKVLKAFNKPFALDGVELNATLSIGISIYPTGGTSSDTLLKHADIAMYRAKAQGRNNFVIFTDTLNKQVKRIQEIDSCLNNAIMLDELYICYQPIFNIKQNKIESVEALLRWRNDDLNNPGPDEFIPVAEMSSLIEKIGLWVLNKSLEEFVVLVGECKVGDIKLSLNVSPKQINDDDFMLQLSKGLCRHNISPDKIIIELTETCIMDNIEHSTDIMTQLGSLGVKIAVDDFGTGYSSMLYLKKLPLNYLKIDKEFVGDIPNDVNDIAIVSAIISLSNKLGIEVIAEGVETKQQLNFIKQEGCSNAQGYLFAKPMPLKETIEYLHQWDSKRYFSGGE
ncbi:MAG: EAL domain-containing protein [Coxiellaceae bacterium]|nr:EAL domain-containing protein [Coxiellaceae bacterium]